MMDSVGVLFEIERLGGLYGLAAFRILFEALGARLLAGCALRAGDTAATLGGAANLFCIAVDSFDVEKLGAIRSALDGCSAGGLLPPAYRYLEYANVRHEPLVPAGRITAAGEFDLAGGLDPWAEAAWKQYRSSVLGGESLVEVGGPLQQADANSWGQALDVSPPSRSRGLRMLRWFAEGVSHACAAMRPTARHTSAMTDSSYAEFRERGLRALADGRAEEAVVALQRAAWLCPDLAEAHLEVGRVLERVGKVEAARQAFLRARQIEPGYPEVGAALAVLPPPPPGRRDFRSGQTVISSSSGEHYEILEVKRGGFGAVYVVRDARTALLAALKTFQARFLWREEDQQRFLREALAWVMLDVHPNIVTALQLDIIEGFPCVLMEYVKGGDLSRVLKDGPLTARAAITLALQFCDGLQYAHEKLGIVHRDVKPANCLLTEDWTLKVADFGLSLPLGSAMEARLGPAGSVEERVLYTTPMGTPRYMAPEQFERGAVLDKRTDIYAFGIMFYQMLTGDLPDDGREARAHILANAQANRVPQPLLEVILRCVETDPARRLASFAETRALLAEEYRHASGKRAPDPPRPSRADVVSLIRRGQALGILERHQEALQCYDRVLEDLPNEEGLLVWCMALRGTELHNLERYEEALASYECALLVRPQDERDHVIVIREHTIWMLKGLSVHALERYEEALGCFERAISLDAQYSKTWGHLAMTQGALGKLDEALACCEHGLSVDPRDAGLWLDKGLVLWGSGRHEEGLACFDRGLEIEPRNSVLWRRRAELLKELGLYQDALLSNSRSLETRSNSADGRSS